MSYSEFFIILFLNVTFLFIWFNTTFVYEYGKLFGFSRFFKKYEKTSPDTMLPQYFYSIKEDISRGNSIILFFVKLTTCVFCLGFWSSLALCSYISHTYFTPIIYILTLLIYGHLKKLYNFS